jgi:uncharacterized protein YbjT (DUF2867 family)
VAQAADKNSFIQSTAKLAKKHGVKRLVAVCPIEHDLFWTEDKSTPVELRNEAQQKALESSPNMTILNSNLVFGKQAYLLHFMAQSAAAGKISKSIGSAHNYQYKPVGSDDLANAVTTALAKFDQAKGQRFTVNGAQSASLKDILHLIEKSVGKQEGNTSLSTSLGISDFFEEFFVGIAQDKNMARFAEFMEANHPNLEDGSPDFHQHFGVNHEQKLAEFYSSTRLREEDLLHPIFSNYKMASLD